MHLFEGAFKQKNFILILMEMIMITWRSATTSSVVRLLVAGLVWRCWRIRIARWVFSTIPRMQFNIWSHRFKEGAINAKGTALSEVYPENFKKGVGFAWFCLICGEGVEDIILTTWTFFHSSSPLLSSSCRAWIKTSSTLLDSIINIPWHLNPG